MAYLLWICHDLVGHEGSRVEALVTARCKSSDGSDFENALASHLAADPQDYGRCGCFRAGPAASCGTGALNVEAAGWSLQRAITAWGAGDDRALPGISRVETMWTTPAILLTLGRCGGCLRLAPDVRATGRG